MKFVPYFARCVDPGQVAEVRVSGDAHHFCVQRFKLIHRLTESNDFCRTHKGTEETGKSVLFKFDLLFLAFQFCWIKF